MKIDLTNARESNYNDFKNEINDALKQKMSEHPAVQEYLHRISNANAKSSLFKQIQEF